MHNPRSISRFATRVLAGAALAFAVAIPMALPSVAGAAVSSITSVAFTPGGAGFFGQGASGTLAISGTGFADNGGTVTISSNAPGLTFSNGAESSSSSATADFASSASTVPGNYTLTLSDSNGTSPAADFTVNAAPSVSLVSPSTLSDGNGPTTITITGAGFTTATPPTVSAVSVVNGTSLTVGPVSGNSATSLSFSLTPTNSVTNDPATAGAYNVTVTNSDGGTTTANSAITVTAYGAANVSPSAVPAVTAPTNTPITISGSGFEVGASVSLSGAVCTGATIGDDNAQITGAVVTSPTLITATLAQGTPTGTNTAAECDLTVSNPSVIDGGNGASFTLPGAIGIGEASTVAPTITATSATAAIVPGSPATTLTLTGTGFSYETTASAFTGTSTNPAAGVTLVNTGANAGTSATFTTTVASGATAGSDNIVAANGSSTSNAFAAGLSVVGPVIVSQAPLAIAVGAPDGTSITLTGTGFTNTTTGTVSPGATGIAGIISYTSPTTMTLVITTPPTGSSTSSPATVTLSQVEPGAGTSVSPPFTLSINADPAVTGAVTYASTVAGVGGGATGQVVYIHGTGFETGATVGSFVNGSGTPDSAVTASVTSVTPTLITAKVAIAAGDANIADGYTVTNPDGGFFKVTATQYPLVINAGPTITAVSPAAATASATNTFTITGTGFQTGVVVTPSSDGTCTSATLTGTTSITVSCTLGAAPLAPATSVTLQVTNLDGGSASSAVVLAAKTVTPPPTTLKVTKITHVALHRGHTVTFVIRGTNLEGARVSTGVPRVRARTVRDTATVLVVNVTANRLAASRVYHLTIRSAHGSSRIGFSVFR